MSYGFSIVSPHANISTVSCVLHMYLNGRIEILQIKNCAEIKYKWKKMKTNSYLSDLVFDENLLFKPFASQ